jgi:hypothetical protein
VSFYQELNLLFMVALESFVRTINDSIIEQVKGLFRQPYVLGMFIDCLEILQKTAALPRKVPKKMAQILTFEQCLNAW